MKFRKANEADINDIMKIIRQAQDYFKENSINQWQNNYPNIDIIKGDIDNKYTFVLENNGEIVGTLALSYDGEKTYDIIYDGEWLSNNKYGVIHRMAVDNKYKGQGLSEIIIKHAEDICLEKNVHSIKIDTHLENKSMQRAIEKSNFKYCGTIYIADKSSRMAFEKLF